MWNHEVVLIGETIVLDEWGNEKYSEERVTVLCKKKSVTRSEFYSAGQAGFKPELVIEVKGFEYTGQRLVEFEGMEFTVIRTFGVGHENLELICERKGANA